MGLSSQIAIFPGTFDPFTNGHLDITRRASRLFGRVIVAVAQNPQKAELNNHSARASVIRQCVADMPNVTVESFCGLTVDFCRKVGSGVLLRGIRNSSDLQAEIQMAMTNRTVAGVETVFLLTSPEHAFLSSSLIRQIASMGGDVSAMVPPAVLESLSNGKKP